MGRSESPQIGICSSAYSGPFFHVPSCWIFLSFYLNNPDGWAESWLDLTQMDDTGDTDDLQHAVPVVGRRELVVLLRAPGVGTTTPAKQDVPHHVHCTSCVWSRILLRDDEYEYDPTSLCLVWLYLIMFSMILPHDVEHDPTSWFWVWSYLMTMSILLLHDDEYDPTLWCLV